MLPVIGEMVEAISNDHSEDIKVVALRILQASAAFDGCCEVFGSHNGVQKVLDQLHSPAAGEELRQAACDALAVLVSNSASQGLAEEVRLAGGILLLVQLLSADHHLDTRAAAAAALGSVAYESCSEPIVEAGAVPALIDLLREGGDACSSAADALLNLMEGQTRDAIIAAGAVGCLVPLLGEAATGSDLQLTVAMALNNLASTRESRKQIVAAGGVERLVGAMQMDDDLEDSWRTTQYATWTLTKLASDAQHKSKIRDAGGSERAQGLVRRAVELSRADEATKRRTGAPAVQEAALCAAIHLLHSLVQDWPEAQAELLGMDVMGHMVDLMRSSSSDVQEAVAGLVLNLVEPGGGGDVEAAARRTEALIELGVVEPLTRVLMTDSSTHGGGGGDSAEKEFAARALTHLVRAKSSRIWVRNSGGLAALVAMLQDAREEQQEAAVLVLEAMAEDEDMMEPIKDAGAVPLLIGTLSEDSNPRQTEQTCHSAASTLKHLSYNSECCAAIYNCGGATALLETLRSGSSTMQILAGMTLQNLAIDPVAGPMMCSVSIGPLKDYMLEADAWHIIHPTCAMILLNFTENSANHKIMLNSGIIPALFRAMQAGTEDETAESATLAIVRLAGSQQGLEQIMGADGTQALCRVLDTSNTTLQRAAAQALYCLVTEATARATMLQPNICPALVAMLGASDEESVAGEVSDGVLASVAGLLLTLTQSSNEKPLPADMVDRLAPMLAAHSETLQQIAAGCLCSIASPDPAAILSSSQLQQLVKVLVVAITGDKHFADFQSGVRVGPDGTWLLLDGRCVVNPSVATKLLRTIAECEVMGC